MIQLLAFGDPDDATIVAQVVLEVDGLAVDLTPYIDELSVQDEPRTLDMSGTMMTRFLPISERVVGVRLRDANDRVFVSYELLAARPGV